MLRSMTGYSSATASANGSAVTVTLKSVNHRFLDLHLRVPPEIEPFEPKLRQALRAKLARGHVDVTVIVDRPGGVDVHFDRALVHGYFEAFNKLRDEMHLASEPDINALLKLPGAMTVQPAGATEAETAMLDSLLFQALDSAVEAMDGMRRKEGAALCAELLSRARGLKSIAAKIADLREGADRRIFERLKLRITELAGQAAAPERIAQEAAILTERGDVSEEIA